MERKLSKKRDPEGEHKVREFTGEEMCKYYFNLVESKDGVEKYSCKICKPKCTRTRNKGSGYSNLTSHVKQCHPSYKEDMSANRPLDKYIISKKLTNIYGWIDWIVTHGLPFSHCEKPLTQKYSSLAPVSLKTYMKYMHVMTRSVEKKISVRFVNLFLTFLLMLL
jgi:hypothetical protein